MAPCDWDVDPTALGVCSTWADRPPALQATALHLATLFLWAATGRQYGPCPVEVRPAQDRGEPDAYRAYPVWPGQDPVVSGPYLFAGTWRNCGCGAGCCCRPMCSVVLRGPVAGIVEVLVGDEEISPDAYRVDVADGAYHLVRLDGTCWPTCQDFSANPGEAGAFVVRYLYGRELPEALEVAAALLACEYAKALTGGPCRLPSRMTRLSRQGVEVEVEPPAPDGLLTGIREVDAVITALNPGKRQGPPTLLSLDLPESCDRITVAPVGGS